MPPGWATLPLHSEKETTPPNGSMEVYSQDSTSGNIIHKGYICPRNPEELSVTTLKKARRPKGEVTTAKKLDLLKRKIRKEEEESEGHMAMRKRLKLADPIVSSSQLQDVLTACQDVWTVNERDDHEEITQRGQGQAAATDGGPTPPKHVSTGILCWMDPNTGDVPHKEAAKGEEPQQTSGQYGLVCGGLTTDLQDLYTDQQWTTPNTAHLQTTSEVLYNPDSELPDVSWLEEYTNPSKGWDEELNQEFTSFLEHLC